MTPRPRRGIERPAPFSRMTIRDLWTDPHVSAQMLSYHLDPSVDAASRQAGFIDRSVAWIVGAFDVARGARVLDLGCGPGLYAIRLARAGARVTAVDFSERSIAYARDAAAREGLAIDYVEGDYLAWESPDTFDLALLIFCDYCAMGPAERSRLAGKVARLLAPGGAFLLDVVSTAALRGREETASDTVMPDGGFWSAGPFEERLDRLVYPAEAVTLDRYEIVEADRTRTIYNWLQQFDPASLAAELRGAGLEVASVLGDVAGAPYDPDGPEFAVVARRAGDD